jgi:hypothetical protein
MSEFVSGATASFRKFEDAKIAVMAWYCSPLSSAEMICRR